MKTIFEYISSNREKLTEDNFNPVDSLVLARLSYLPMHKIINTNEKMKLKELLNILKCFRDEFFVDVANDKKFVNFLSKSNRFLDLELSDCVESVSKDESKQFGALVIDLGFSKYISFKGTDRSFVGIKEDLDMSYKNIPAQKEVLKYFNNIAKKYDNSRFILGGHSKGGNIAIYAGIYTDDKNRNRIKSIYNFDGPGFLDEVLEEEGYNKILNKIYTILPTSSFIGLLLKRKEKVKFVNSDNFFVMQHDVFSWHVSGKDFSYTTNQTKISKTASKSIKKLQESISSKEKEALIESINEIPSIISKIKNRKR